MDHVFRSEYIFLENIYSEKEMKQMKIEKFERNEEKLNKILDELDNFSMSIEESRNDGDDLEIDEIIKKIKNIETSLEDKGKATKENTIGFLYGRSICFVRSDKFKGKYPISSKFLANMISIVKNHIVIHHSHTTGKIIGYAHNFCNLRCKENYYTIPILAHNQFRFDFYLFLKGIRPRVWKTTEIAIGEENPTDKNFVIIRNQVRFIDTVKHFQQSLASLADSMTDIEKENVRKICQNVLAEKLLFLNEEDEKWILDYLASGKGMIPYQMISDFDSLNITPEKDFLNMRNFIQL